MPANAQYEIRQRGKQLNHTDHKLATGEPIRVIAYGDSISSCDFKPGWFGGAKVRDNWWGNVLERLLNGHFPHQPFQVKSFGIGGQNAYEGLGRAHFLNALGPDLVLLEFGINDCGYTDIPPSATANALTRIITHIDLNLQSDIMIIGVAGNSPLSPPNNHFEETSQAIRQVAETQLVPFVDLRSVILKATENGRMWEVYHNGPDDCHPNDKGHALWAETVYKNLADILD